MQSKRYIQSFRCCFLDPENEQDSLARHRASLPKRTARRMSKLGILLHAVLDGASLDFATTLVYGTSFTEANALESFLESIPYASPRAFQTSIHPGGIEQALILKQQPVGAFFPLAGASDLFLQMLKIPFTATTPKTLICGGEEKGTWLQEFGVAYSVTFAFAMMITDEPGDYLGSVAWDPENPGNATPRLNMEHTIRAMDTAQAVSLGGPDHGYFEISWK